MHSKSKTNEGLMPDSGSHIARLGKKRKIRYFLNLKVNFNFCLESKLQKLKNQNINSKVNGKNLISSLKEFNEIYMHDYLKNGHNPDSLEDSSYTGTVAINYLEVFLATI